MERGWKKNTPIKGRLKPPLIPMAWCVDALMTTGFKSIYGSLHGCSQSKRNQVTYGTEAISNELSATIGVKQQNTCSQFFLSSPSNESCVWPALVKGEWHPPGDVYPLHLVLLFSVVAMETQVSQMCSPRSYLRTKFYFAKWPSSLFFTHFVSPHIFIDSLYSKLCVRFGVRYIVCPPAQSNWRDHIRP